MLGYNLIWGEKINVWKRILSCVDYSSLSLFFSVLNRYNASGGIIGLLIGPPLQNYFGKNAIYLILVLTGLGSLYVGYKIFLTPFKEAISHYLAIRRERIPLPDNFPSPKDRERTKGRKAKRQIADKEIKDKRSSVTEKNTPHPTKSAPANC